MTNELKQQAQTLKTEIINAITKFQKETGSDPKISIGQISIKPFTHCGVSSSIYEVDISIEL